MFVFVEDGCIGCGVCESLCPHVFRTQDGPVHAGRLEMAESEIPAAAAARDSCPVCVIDLAAD